LDYRIGCQKIRPEQNQTNDSNKHTWPNFSRRFGYRQAKERYGSDKGVVRERGTGLLLHHFNANMSAATIGVLL